MLSTVFIPAGPVDSPTFSYIHREKFDLEHMYELLNCDLIECIGLGKRQYMYVDELGRQKNLAFNGLASMIYHRMRGGDMIVGNALLMGANEEGETVNVSNDLLLLVAKLATSIGGV